MRFNGYSKEWLDRLNPYLNAVQDRTWEDTVALFRLHGEQVVKKTKSGRSFGRRLDGIQPSLLDRHGIKKNQGRYQK